MVLGVAVTGHGDHLGITGSLGRGPLLQCELARPCIQRRELLRLDDKAAVVVYRIPRDVRLEDVLLPVGTLSLGYFWQDRPYNVYHWVDQSRETLALYFNIADGTRISEDTIEWRDLTVDVLLTPDGRCRVLDEDELPSALDPELRQYIDDTRDLLCQEPLSRLAEYAKLSRSLIKGDS